jgi:hypothetical protein
MIAFLEEISKIISKGGPMVQCHSILISGKCEGSAAEGVAVLCLDFTRPAISACMKSSNDVCSFWSISLTYDYMLNLMQNDAGLEDDAEGLKAFAPFFAEALQRGFSISRETFQNLEKASPYLPLILSYNICGLSCESVIQLECIQSPMDIAIFNTINDLHNAQRIKSRVSSDDRSSVEGDPVSSSHIAECSSIQAHATSSSAVAKNAQELVSTVMRGRIEKTGGSSPPSSSTSASPSRTKTGVLEKTSRTPIEGEVSHGFPKEEEGEEITQEGTSKKRKALSGQHRRGRGGVNLFVRPR